MKKYFFTLGMFVTNCIIPSEASNDSSSQEMVIRSKNSNNVPCENHLPVIGKKKISNYYTRQFENAKQFEDLRELENSREYEEPRLFESGLLFEDLKKLEKLKESQNFKKFKNSRRFESFALSLEKLLQDNISNQNQAIQIQSDVLNKAMDQKFFERDQEMAKHKNEFVDTLNVLLKKTECLEAQLEEDKLKRVDNSRALHDCNGQIFHLKKSFQKLEQRVFEKLSYMENNMHSLTVRFLQIASQITLITQRLNTPKFLDNRNISSLENDEVTMPALKSSTNPGVGINYNFDDDDDENNSAHMPLVQLEGVLKNSSNESNDD